MAIWSRGKALLTMTSPLGADALIPISLDADEAISTPFRFEVHAVSQLGRIDPDDLLNRPACVTVQANGVPVRHCHGIVQSITADNQVRGLGPDQFHHYRLLLLPRLWFLGQTTDCRVFQQLSEKDILTRLFHDAELTDFSIQPAGTVREYTVQFNETDLRFATRLMEEAGWFYFFEHAPDGHKLVIADDNASFKDIPSAQMHLRGGDTDATRITGWTHPTGTVRGKMKLKDYDPANPWTTLQAEKSTRLKTGGAPQRDDFRWPALSFDNDAVSARAGREMEAAEATASLFHGASRFAGLAPGGKFSLADRPATADNGTYVVQSVSQQVRDDTWLNQSGSTSYVNRFAVFPVAVPWRQPMTTPRPRMTGIHTALVLGPETGEGQQPKTQQGEEIYTDKLARVKVRFFWDHRGEARGGAACWARVVQPWAGNGWGAQFTPRVGTEVAVAFVDGDPDRPIVIGGLYNGRDQPIYESDSEKTKSGFRTRSSLQGNGSEFNEFTFDDKAGEELILLHAQKDLKTEVEHDQTLTVDNCRMVTVKKDETVSIENNQDTKIGNKQTIQVQSGRSATILSGGDELTVQSGDYTVTISTGGMKVSALTSIELTVGANSIKIDQEQVAINALMVKVSGEMKLDLGAPMSTLAGDAILSLSGALMKLN